MKTKIIYLNPEEKYIRLDALLKSEGVFTTGGQAKIAIQNGNVEVNGEICTMRGKKLYNSDIAKFNNVLYEVHTH